MGRVPMSPRLLSLTLRCKPYVAGVALAAACATPDPRPYLAAARMHEAREGRPSVETPGLRHTRLADGSIVAEVLRLPDGTSLRHGVERETFASGAKRAERHFERDVPVGEWTQWYEDGTVRSHLAHTSEPSPMRFFAPSGALSAEGPVVGGVREGVWRFYHPGGALAKEGPYVRGKREGEWVLYDDAGAVVARERYELDVRVE